MSIKIAMVSQCALKRELGGGKVIIETAEALRQAGANVEVFSGELFTRSSIKQEMLAFDNFLNNELSGFDVIDYDFKFRYAKKNTNDKRLFVARSVLLPLHNIKIPCPKLNILWNIKKAFSNMVKPKAKQKIYSKELIVQCFHAADLVCVPNTRDFLALNQIGISSQNIVLQPYGLSHERFNALKNAKCQTYCDEPVVGFLGTFDYRKGCLDIPKIFSAIASEIPRVRFKLIGTKGLFQSEKKVRSFFSTSLNSRITIIESFQTDELPMLLADVTVGIFPSYLESFGYSVVEMLAAGIPVFAYDVPGPCDILPREWLSPPGDWARLAAYASSAILTNDKILLTPDALIQKYNMETIGKKLLRNYMIKKEARF